MHVLLALAFGNLSSPSISFNRIIAGEKIITWDDLYSIHFGAGDLKKGRHKLMEIRNLGLLIWS
jgi:hypothetical protein